MNAPAPSPDEQAVIERFGIFDEERIVEEVARALCEREGLRWDQLARMLGDRYRRLAAAAVAAYRATDGDLRTRMAEVADNLVYYAGKTDGGTYAGGLQDAAGQIRDALQ